MTREPRWLLFIYAPSTTGLTMWLGTFGNPASCWCYAAEDFCGVVKRVAEKCRVMAKLVLSSGVAGYRALR